ncbi:hypothetical protein L3Q82_025339, partial [Scortum barcoo]
PVDINTVSLTWTSQEKKIQTQLSTIATGVKKLTERQPEQLQQAVVAQVNQLTAQLQRMAARLEEIASPKPTTPAAPQPASSTPWVTSSPRPVRLAPLEKYSVDSGSGGIYGFSLVRKSGGVGYGVMGLRSSGMSNHLSSTRGIKSVAWAEAEIQTARLYAISGPERKAMGGYIEASLRSSIIRQSSSPDGGGFFSVGKKDGSFRPCIDYSTLNNITVNREGGEWKNGFNTPTGYYEYLVMPFGLTNKPAIFQGFINEVCEYLNDFVFIYLDDILIFSPDPITHQRHVRQVLICLLENKLFVKAEKCEFHVSSVSFLAFIMSPSHIKMNPEKVVHGYQPPLFPTNEEEVTVPSAYALAMRCRKVP